MMSQNELFISCVLQIKCGSVSLNFYLVWDELGSGHCILTNKMLNELK